MEIDRRRPRSGVAGLSLMAETKKLGRYNSTEPPYEASVALRNWLRDELERLALSSNAGLEAIDLIRATPRMYLAGDADDFNLDTVDSKFVNYTQGGSVGDVPNEPSNALGEIYIPTTGLYQMAFYAYILQPSVTQNETIRLLLDVGGVRGVVSAFDVTSNQTDDRTFSAVLTRVLTEGDVLSMWMDATGDLGGILVQQTTFEASMILGADVEQVADTNLDWIP